MGANMDSAGREPQLLLINHHQALSLSEIPPVPEQGIPAGAPRGPCTEL